MRATEIIRGLLDLIDEIEQDKDQIKADVTVSASGDDVRRFQQIVDLNQDTPTQYSNSPDEKYSDIDAVTTAAGGGVNGPKEPEDIRGNSFRIYPSKDRP